MTFKLYVEDGLENSITSISEYNFFTVSSDNYIDLIDNHIASKLSQDFLFIVSHDLLGPLYDIMMKHNQSVFQFILIGKKFNDDLDLPLEHILDVINKRVSKNALKWYLVKFENLIKIKNSVKIFSEAESKDFLDDQNELISIGQLLSEERDRERLIKKILSTSLKITGADAGCVFLVVDQDDGSKGLLFKYSYTFSRNIDFHEFVMPLDEKSIAGFCAFNGEVVNIPDAYNINKSATFSFNRSIDEKNSYISRSMLVIPMKNHLGEILGVLQLINCKEHFDEESNLDETESHRIYLDKKEDFLNKVYPFATRYEDLMLSVAGQASVALDNIKMIQQLEDQFEGMVRASVDAIDSKDPATSGHSFRVAKMGVKFLKTLNNINSGEYSSINFLASELKQMEYSALLHDYGKVYIDNDIFLKAKKLFPKDFSILMLRLDLIIQILKNQDKNEVTHKKVEEVMAIRDMVRSLNEPRIFHDNPEEIIDNILRSKDSYHVFDGDNNLLPILTHEEVINLQIARGTLNDDERREIESHVTYTTNFLKSIPWPKELSRIPEIAGGHHEMLDGSGYPNKLTAKDLSVESRILAVLDIFDALSASDRPYKDAVPFSKVKAILFEEAKRGRIDLSLVELFFEQKIYQGLYSTDSETVNV